MERAKHNIKRLKLCLWADVRGYSRVVNTSKPRTRKWEISWNWNDQNNCHLYDISRVISILWEHLSSDTHCSIINWKIIVTLATMNQLKDGSDAQRSCRTQYPLSESCDLWSDSWWSSCRESVFHSVCNVRSIVEIHSSHTETPVLGTVNVPFLFENVDVLGLKLQYLNKNLMLF